MDSRQLRYFIAVYEQRNLSRAADQANVAQSALSHHIANLEAEFATPLFERTMIEAALNATKGQRQEAAKRLGWGRNTLTRKIKELGMGEED